MAALFIIGIIIFAVCSTSTERRVMRDVNRMMKENSNEIARNFNSQYGREIIKERKWQMIWATGKYSGGFYDGEIV